MLTSQVSQLVIAYLLEHLVQIWQVVNFSYEKVPILQTYGNFLLSEQEYPAGQGRQAEFPY